MADEALPDPSPAPPEGPPSTPPSRPEALRALAKAATPVLRGEEVRVCLAGPRGSGKSALLRELLPELHRAAAERGLRLPIFFVDGRPPGTAYALLAALVRLAGGEAPATGWSWGRLAAVWRAQVPGPAVVAIDHADEAAGTERLLRLLSQGPLGLFVTVRSGSSLERGWWLPVHIPGPAGSPPPPSLPLESAPDAPPPGFTASGGGPPARLTGPGRPAPKFTDPGGSDAAPSGRGDRGVGGRASAGDEGCEVRRPAEEEAGGMARGFSSRGDSSNSSGKGVIEHGGGGGLNSQGEELLGHGGGGGLNSQRRGAFGHGDLSSTISHRPPPAASGGRGVFGHGNRSPSIHLLDDAPRLLLTLLAGEGGPVTTGRLWRAYRRAAPEAGLCPLTLRRVSGLLRDLEEGGWVSAPVINRGRGGRTKWAVLTEEARRMVDLEGFEAPSGPREG